MDEETKIDRLNELLPKINQREKLGIIYRVYCDLTSGNETEIEHEFIDICSELEDDRTRIDVIQALAKSLEK